MRLQGQAGQRGRTRARRLARPSAAPGVHGLSTRAIQSHRSQDAMTTALVRPDILYGWKGLSLFIVNTRGECGVDQALSGYYFREARFLRTLRFAIDGDAPWRCEAASVEPHILSFNYVYPEVEEYGGGG